MNLITNCVLSDIFHSDKTGNNYYTMVDTVTGGIFSLSLNDGEMVGLECGAQLHIDIVVKPRLGDKGNVRLEYLRGRIDRLGVLETEKKGGEK